MPHYRVFRNRTTGWFRSTPPSPVGRGGGGEGSSDGTKLRQGRKALVSSNLTPSATPRHKTPHHEPRITNLPGRRAMYILCVCTSLKEAGREHSQGFQERQFPGGPPAQGIPVRHRGSGDFPPR